MRRRSSFSLHWDDLADNSREELLQIMNDMQLPYFHTITSEQLMAVIRQQLKPLVNECDDEVAKIYTKDRHIKRFDFPVLLVHRLVIICMLVGTVLIYHRMTAPPPFCFGRHPAAGCRPCPEGANCGNGWPKCSEGYLLTIAGCRSKKLKKQYRAAQKAARYIAERDGDCVDIPPPLTEADFRDLFPKVDLAFLKKEPAFGIITQNGTVQSLKPKLSLICRILTKMDQNVNLFGGCAVAFVAVAALYIWNRRNVERRELAREIAKQTHKILSTTDKEIYMYDIKVQLRVKYPQIDHLWKYVIRAVEEDSHVLVGTVGARHEVYWKWIHG
jgi:hypothetical protein